MPIPSRKHNDGFVLLLVLLVLTISGVTLAIASRRVARQTIAATQAQRDCQVHWGTLSCRAACLPATERFLRAVEIEQERPVVEVRRAVDLGGMRFNLLIADEQAKANMNLLADRGGAEAVALALHALQADRRTILPVLPRPAAKPAAGVISSAPMRYGSFDQLFAISAPSELIGDEESPGVASRVTCWSGGEVNLKRAELPVLRQALAGLLSETHLIGLLSYRQEHPACTLGEMLGALELTDKQLEAVRPHVTDTSRSHSLWVIARGTHRTWRHLYIDQAGDGRNDAQQWSFQW